MLKAFYRYSRESNGAALEEILFARQFEVEEKDAAVEALKACLTSKADFSDCLMGVRHRVAGCQTIITIGKAATTLGTFHLLQSE